MSANDCKGFLHLIETDLEAPFWLHTLPAEISDYLLFRAEFLRLYPE